MKTKRILEIVLIGASLAVVCLAAIGFIIINTAAFRKFLRSEISEQALKHAGARVKVESVSPHWTHLTIDLNNVLVSSDAPRSANEPAFLRTPRLEVGIEFLPLLHGHLELSKLILDRPIVRLKIDSQGQNNLPKPPSTGSSRGVQELFDLEIRDCAIHSGELYYNDQETPLDAEVHHLTFDAAYDLLTAQYEGSLSYDNGRLSSSKIATIPHTIRLQFTADRSGMSVDPLVLTSANSRLTLKARLTGFSDPEIQGTYEGNVETEEVANTFHEASIPVGNVALTGSLAYQSRPRRTFLSSVTLQGRITSKRLQYRGSRLPIDATSLSANYVLRASNLQVNHLLADALGGRIEGTWEMHNIGTVSPSSHLDASVRGVSLSTASNALAPRDVRRIPLVGTTDLDVRADWPGSITNAVAHVRLAISSKGQTNSARRIPVDGIVQIDYDGPRNTIAVGQSHLQTMNTTLSLSGMLRPRGNSMLAVKATTSDLAEVRALATLVQSAMRTPQSSTKAEAEIPSMSGSAALVADITGTAKNPNIQGRLSAQNLAIDGTSWRSLALRASAKSNLVNVQNGTVIGSKNEQINFEGQAGLRRWSVFPASPIKLQSSVARIPVTEIEAFARLHYPVTGMLSAQLSFHGTRSTPQGNATITLANGTAWNEPIENLTLNAQSNDGAIHSMLDLRTPAGNLTSNATYEITTQQFDVQAHSSTINLAKITALQKRGSIQGIAALSAMASGTLHNPQLDAKLTIPQLHIQGQAFSKLTAGIGVANERANLELHTVADQGSIDAKGDVALTGNHYSTASLDVHALPIAAIASELLPPQASHVGGHTEIHVTLNGPLSEPKQIEAHLQIPTLNVTYDKEQIALTHPLQADYRGGILTVLPAQIQGLGTNLTFGGTVPIEHEAAYSLMADGTVDLSVLQKFAPNLHSSGQVNIYIEGRGRSSRPDIHGQLQVKNAVFSTDSLPVGIEGLNAQINISGDRADIANLSGTAGGGSVSAKGFVSFGKNPLFNLGLNAQSVRIRYPEGLRSVLSGQINLEGTPSNSNMTGRVLVDNLSFTQQFDLAQFAGSFSDNSGGSTSSELENNMMLRIAVQSSQDINLANRQVSMAGSANLNIIGTLADPVVLGRVILTSGDVFYLGKRFEVQSGTIAFANPARTEPVLNMNVTTTIEAYDITLNLTGPADRLRTNYTSDPSLPQVDIIHLLAFGNTSEEAASQPSQSATLGAESVLAQGVSSQVAGKLENLTGISQLTIDPLATNSQGDTGAEIGIQERITGSLLFTYSTNVTATQEQTVELQYDLDKRWSVTALRDQNGGYGLNLRYHKTF